MRPALSSLRSAKRGGDPAHVADLQVQHHQVGIELLHRGQHVAPGAHPHAPWSCRRPAQRRPRRAPRPRRWRSGRCVASVQPRRRRYRGPPGHSSSRGGRRPASVSGASVGEDDRAQRGERGAGRSPRTAGPARAPPGAAPTWVARPTRCSSSSGPAPGHRPGRCTWSPSVGARQRPARLGPPRGRPLCCVAARAPANDGCIRLTISAADVDVVVVQLVGEVAGLGHRVGLR